MSQHLANGHPTTTARTEQRRRLAGPPLLQVEGLRVAFPTRPGAFEAVRGASFAVRQGTVVGIVGESGSGKSVTASAVIRLVPRPGRITSGTIQFRGEELTTASDRRMQALRGKEIATIFQNPMTSLNPAFTIGRQMSDMITHHDGVTRSSALERAAGLLGQVGIPEPERQLDAYPHQLSGGMRQRVVIAMAISCNPQLLIADEPTTALDVTIQAQILVLLDRIAADPNRAIVLISHDFGVIANLCDEVVVMYRGEIVEQGPVDEVLLAPQHPYTRALLAAIPRPGQRGRRLATVSDELTAVAGSAP